MAQIQINELKSTAIELCSLQEQLNILGSKSGLFFIDRSLRDPEKVLWQGYARGTYEIRIEDDYKDWGGTFLVFSQRYGDDSDDRPYDKGYIQI